MHCNLSTLTASNTTERVLYVPIIVLTVPNECMIFSANIRYHMSDVAKLLLVGGVGVCVKT
jgi:hypothetical protein